MRRWLAYLLVWSLGTAATVGACWLGLRSVLDAAVPHRDASLSAAELVAPRLIPSPDPVPGPGLSPQPLSASPSPSPSAGPAPATSTAGSSAPSSSPEPTGTVAASTSWEPVATTRGGTAYRRTFTVQAGAVTFFAGPTDVHVLDLDVASGYAVVPTRYGANSLLISLVSAGRTSRVFVSWRDGPYAEVSETVV